MKWIFLSLFVLARPTCHAQSISGKWEGRFNNMVEMFNMAKLVVDIIITDDTIVSGSSHLYYNGGKYEHYTIIGVYDPSDSTIFFMEDETIGVDLGLFAGNCLGNYMMKLSVTDDILRFDGKWKDNAKGFVKCPSAKVYFEKKQSGKDSLSMMHRRQDPNLQRKGEIQRLIEIATDEKDSIRIELVDNAQIDNDMVSVYLDDSLVINKEKLTAEPKLFYVSLDTTAKLCSIKMEAESMGSIPPCTAVMTVATKRHRYDVTLSSDFGNNAIIQLFLKD